MDKYFETSDIIDLLHKFISYKQRNIKYIESLVGEVIEIEDLKIEYEEETDTFLKESWFYVQLDGEAKNKNENWIDNNFFCLKEFLEGQSSRGDYEIRSLIISSVNQYNNRTEIALKSCQKFEQISNTSFCFQATYSINKDEPLVNQDLWKICESERFIISYFNNIVGSLQDNSISSKEIESILLGQKILKPNLMIDISSIYAKGLDEVQEKAFKIAINPLNNIVLIKGPPGTGKSKIITQLIKHHVFEEKEKVIVATETHAALDSIIENISITSRSNNYSGISWYKSSHGSRNVEYVRYRLMTATNIHHALRQHAKPGGKLEGILENRHLPSWGLNKILPPLNQDFASVFFSTLASSRFEFMKSYRRNFFEDSILILDEVSKLNIIDVLRFAIYAKKVVLFGDDKQLPPIPDKSIVTKNFWSSLDEKMQAVFRHLFLDSVFYKLYHPEMANALTLTNSYRAPLKILNTYNEVSYNSQIVSRAELRDIQFRDSNHRWVKIYHHNPCLFINNKNADIDQFDYINEREINLLIKHLEFLNTHVQDGKYSIMILFVYKNQRDFFNKNHVGLIKKIKKNYLDILIGTIDQMQGHEADFVFLCLTDFQYVGYYQNNFRYIKNIQGLQRVNVALSRSRMRLIIIGNYRSLGNLELWDIATRNKTKYKWTNILRHFHVLEVQDE